MPATSLPDPADHAEDFAHRYAQKLDNLTIGHLYPGAIRDRQAIAARPLDPPRLLHACLVGSLG